MKTMCFFLVLLCLLVLWYMITKLRDLADEYHIQCEHENYTGRKPVNPITWRDWLGQIAAIAVLVLLCLFFVYLTIQLP